MKVKRIILDIHYNGENIFYYHVQENTSIKIDFKFHNHNVDYIIEFCKKHNIAEIQFTFIQLNDRKIIYNGLRKLKLQRYKNKFISII